MRKFLFCSTFRPLVGVFLLFLATTTNAQTDNCTSPTSLTVNATCVATAYSIPGGGGGFSNSGIGSTSCITGTIARDGWYTFTAIGTSTSVGITTNREVGVVIYASSCGGTEAGCIANTTTNGTVTFATTAGTTYYIRILRLNGSNSMAGNICVYGTGGGGGGGSGDDCSDAIDLAAETSPYSGSTTGLNNDFSICSMGSSNDQIFYYDLPDGCSITIQQNSNTYDSRHTMRIGATCPGTTEIDCIDDSDLDPISYSNCTGASVRVWWINGGYSTNNGDFELAWSVTCGGSVGDDCCNPDVIGSLPYTSSTTTCGAGDDYDSGDGCSSSYLNGDDYVYTYTSPGNECVNFTVDNITDASADVGLFIMDGCPSDAATSCVASGTGSNAAAVDVGGITLSAGTYYIIVSTWPTPQCTGFDLSVTSTAAGGTGTDCSNPHNIGSIPFSATGLTTACYGDDFSSADACGSTYMNGDDYVFTYTPSTTTAIAVDLTNTDSDVGLFIMDGCPSSGGTSCVASNTSFSGNPSICGATLTAGTTYYIVVSSDGTPQNTPFDITVREETAPVCGMNYSVSSIAYNPVNYNSGTVITMTDDRFLNGYTSLGFDFCFDGVTYNQTLISSNGYLHFPLNCTATIPGGSGTPDGYSPYSISDAIPNNTDAPTNSILGVWQDINPNTGGTLRYSVTGTAPNRVFAYIMDNIDYFGSSCSQTFTGQILLYETTNIIEIHIADRTVCTAWNSGYGITGLNNYDGTTAVVASNHNYPNLWTASNEGFRFTPNCGVCTILPVDLLTFTGKNEGKTNVLDWTVAASDHTQKYSIERSFDGQQFSTIGEVTSNENTAQADVMNYRFTDKTPQTGINYYRLLLLDGDGTETYSEIITIKTESGTITGKLFPNPATERFTLEINSPEQQEVRILITDATGRQVAAYDALMEKGVNQNVYPTADLGEGVFQVVVTDQSGRMQQRFALMVR